MPFTFARLNQRLFSSLINILIRIFFTLSGVLNMNCFRVLASATILSQLLFSCNSHTMAHQVPVQDSVRVMDSTEKQHYQDRLTGYFDSFLNRSGFSGGILVAKNGSIVYEHYQGHADVAGTQAIDSLTPFHVASTSKTFTATAIMQLAGQGRLQLDDTLQTFFDSFPYPGIKVRNLLNHSSGIPYYVNVFDQYKWDKKQTATNADVLAMLKTYKPPVEFAPGARFRYCNTNFVLLALIVEKLSGRSFPDYVQDSIFARCGMKNSYVLHLQNLDKYKTSFRGNSSFAPDFLDGIYGDKNVYSTCRDLMKYDSAIRTHVLLPQPWYDQAWTPNYKDNHYSRGYEYYGLGWRLKVFPDKPSIVYHNGWWHGNNAVFQRMPADTAVIIITGNKYNTNIYRASKAANIFRTYYTDTVTVDEEQGGNIPPKKNIYKKQNKKRVVPLEKAKSGRGKKQAVPSQRQKARR